MYIRIKIPTPTGSIKYIVDVYPLYHLAIRDVIARIIELCALKQIRVEDLDLLHKGFILPHALSTQYLQ